MYAVTTTSYRAIASTADLAPGETAADVLPDTLLAALKEQDVRQDRDQRLRACDWTQAADAPLTSTEKQAWATYRQALRDVPQQSGFPGSIDWPAAP